MIGITLYFKTVARAFVHRCLSLVKRIVATKAIKTITALACAKVTMFWFPLCPAAMPTKAQTITSPYATSFLVAMTSIVINRATIIIRFAHVSGIIPKPPQFIATRVTAILAIEAMVIQSR